MTGMEGPIIQLNALFDFDTDAGVDDEGQLLGVAQPTGLRPSFESSLSGHTIDIGGEIFNDPLVISPSGPSVSGANR